MVSFFYGNSMSQISVECLWFCMEMKLRNACKLCWCWSSYVWHVWIFYAIQKCKQMNTSIKLLLLLLLWCHQISVFFEWLIFFWLSLFIKSRNTKRRIHVRNSGVWQNVRNCLTHDWHKKTVSKLSQELRFIQGY